MIRTFIQTSEFVKNWEHLGFADSDLQRLELELLKNPKTGDVIRGTGKLRKMQRIIFRERNAITSKK